MYGKFTALEDSFTVCAEKKKWPESKECLKLFQYCFGKEQNGCDAGRDNNRSKRCGTMKLGECLEKSEAQFNFLKTALERIILLVLVLFRLHTRSGESWQEFVQLEVKDRKGGPVTLLIWMKSLI